MLKRTGMVAAGLLLMTGIAFAGVDVSVNVGVPAPRIPAPQVRVIEKETIIIKEKKGHGKHKGHYKEKEGKKKHRGKD
ncbi:hypothetical protein Geob_0016 [Geotalea daltonii FRC-32]|uniref:Uncharacterized protein n=1 Tax=Geotalea daltonii (strain DSM 22248 / JCM 15807 / FRC-32) TaxID=316067 RepID=B9M7T5_GEODF|nr:hypothetical protein [Geotalea daltonii]ACM18393.1 hypothetical protein Geob_0016 [Geotalea daltonii FRC-32]